jgi:site-specific DNA-methyltransferase (adenine-specific)
MINEGLFSSKSPEWGTPQDLFDKLDKEFKFTLDPCCTHENAKCVTHYTREEDGLKQDWSKEVVFMNPPYGRVIGKWIEKAYKESLKGALVVCLIPSRTDTKWWHEYCMKGEIRFIKGRIKFVGENGNSSPAPFPSAIVIFGEKVDPKTEELRKYNVKYEGGFFDKLIDGIQYVRLGDGCPNGCEFCYASKKRIFHGIPDIRARYVKILDMNFLSYPNVKILIKDLPKDFNGKDVRYELVCGVDYRFLKRETARMLKFNGFINPRFAWDGSVSLQYKMHDCWKHLLKVGYTNISCFIIANWKIPYKECLFKLDLLKIWRVKVCDCYYDGQTSPNIKPVYWTEKEIKDFRKKCRKHNQMVLFKIDPELKVSRKKLKPQFSLRNVK